MCRNSNWQNIVLVYCKLSQLEGGGGIKIPRVLDWGCRYIQEGGFSERSDFLI